MSELATTLEVLGSTPMLGVETAVLSVAAAGGGGEGFDSSGLGASPYGSRSASCSERPRSTAPSISTSAGNGGSFGLPNEVLLLPVRAVADDCDVTDVVSKLSSVV